MKRITLLSLLAFVSCTSISQEQAFETVQNDIQESTGQVIQWHGDSSDKELSIGQSDTLNLDEAVRLALSNSTALKVHLEEFGVRQAIFLSETEIPNPTIKGDFLFPLSSNGMREFGIDIGGQVLALLRGPRQKGIREAATLSNQHDLAQMVLAEIAMTRNAYADLLFAERLESLQNTKLELAEAAYETAKEMNTAGNLSEPELMGFRLSMVSEKMQSRRMQFEKEDATRLLERNLALAELKNPISQNLDFLDMSETEKEEFLQVALERNHSLKARMAEMESLGKRANISNLESYLSNLHAGLVIENHDDIWSMGPELEIAIPIFNRGQARRDALVGNFNLAEALFKNETVMTGHDLRSLYEKHELYHDLLGEYSDTILAAVQSSVKGQLQNFNAMQIGVFELIEAKSKEIDLLVEMETLKKDLWLLQSEMDLATVGYSPTLN